MPQRPVTGYRHGRATGRAGLNIVGYHMNMSRKNRRLDTTEIFNERKRYAGGLSSHPQSGVNLRRLSRKTLEPPDA